MGDVGRTFVDLLTFGQMDDESETPQPAASEVIAPEPPPPAPKISDKEVEKNADAAAAQQTGDVKTPASATKEQRQAVATGRASTILTSSESDTLGRKSNKRYALGTGR